MEKYFINENLKKEYKTAILNQKDIRRTKRNTHTDMLLHKYHIQFYIRTRIESSFSYFS